MDNSYKTAIGRKSLSAPVKYLRKINAFPQGTSIIDFGCGRGTDVQFLREMNYETVGYDPHWSQAGWLLGYKYDIVLCTYVLNVVDIRQRDLIIKTLKNLTKPQGNVYITVRRDVKRHHVSIRGTNQYDVRLPFKVVKENSSYCIYKI